MTNMYLAIAVLWVHWLGDFVLQSDVMAKNKSSSVKWLSFHVSTYSAVLWVAFGWKYAAINGVTHWLVDFVSSKVTTKLWAAKESHWFFVVIGFDQAVHLTILLLTLPFISSMWI